jgi:hypothetical protein
MSWRTVAVALAGLALAIGEVGWASDDTGRTHSDEEVYDYTCGHLGTSCESEPAQPKPRKRGNRAGRECGRSRSKARKQTRG